MVNREASFCRGIGPRVVGNSKDQDVIELELQDRLELSLPEGWQSQLPAGALLDDEARMQFVLQLASWNVDNRTGGPFAAAVFARSSSELIAVGVNRAVPQACSLAHAEAVALGLAQKRLATHDLSQYDATGVELVTSGQPCIQCFGMVWWSGINRLVTAATAADIEQICGFDEGPVPADWQQLLQNRAPLPAVEVATEVCRDAACDVLRRYSAAGGANYSPGVS